jgi:adenylylsulfate kinase
MPSRLPSLNYRPCVLWFTGLSGAGKSTTAVALQTVLTDMGCHTYLLDGDALRQSLCKDLGFSEEDRAENLRRIGEVARLMVDAGLLVICATISPFEKTRRDLRARFAPNEFVEVFIDAPLAVCEARDPKGLYRKAREGKITQFTGIDSAYERPTEVEIHLRTDQMDVKQGVQQVMSFLQNNHYLLNY